MRVTSFTHNALPVFFGANYAPGTFDARVIVRLLTIIAFREAFREGSDVPEALRQNKWVVRFLRPIFEMKMKSKFDLKQTKSEVTKAIENENVNEDTTKIENATDDASANAAAEPAAVCPPVKSEDPSTKSDQLNADDFPITCKVCLKGFGAGRHKNGPGCRKYVSSATACRETSDQDEKGKSDEDMASMLFQTPGKKITSSSFSTPSKFTTSSAELLASPHFSSPSSIRTVSSDLDDGDLRQTGAVTWPTLPDSTLLQEQILLFLALSLPQHIIAALKDSVKQFPKLGYNTKKPESKVLEWKMPAEQPSAFMKPLKSNPVQKFARPILPHGQLQTPEQVTLDIAPTHLGESKVLAASQELIGLGTLTVPTMQDGPAKQTTAPAPTAKVPPSVNVPKTCSNVSNLISALPGKRVNAKKKMRIVRVVPSPARFDDGGGMEIDSVEEDFGFEDDGGMEIYEFGGVIQGEGEDGALGLDEQRWLHYQNGTKYGDKVWRENEQLPPMTDFYADSDVEEMTGLNAPMVEVGADFLQASREAFKTIGKVHGRRIVQTSPVKRMSLKDAVIDKKISKSSRSEEENEPRARSRSRSRGRDCDLDYFVPGEEESHTYQDVEASVLNFDDDLPLSTPPDQNVHPVTTSQESVGEKEERAKSKSKSRARSPFKRDVKRKKSRRSVVRFPSDPERLQSIIEITPVRDSQDEAGRSTLLSVSNSSVGLGTISSNHKASIDEKSVVRESGDGTKKLSDDTEFGRTRDGHKQKISKDAQISAEMRRAEVQERSLRQRAERKRAAQHLRGLVAKEIKQRVDGYQKRIDANEAAERRELTQRYHEQNKKYREVIRDQNKLKKKSVKTDVPGLKMVQLGDYKNSGRVFMLKRGLANTFSRILGPSKSPLAMVTNQKVSKVKAPSKPSTKVYQKSDFDEGMIVRIRSMKVQNVSVKYRYQKVPIDDVLGVVEKVANHGICVRFAHSVQRVNTYKCVNPDKNILLKKNYTLQGRKCSRSESIGTSATFCASELLPADDYNRCVAPASSIAPQSLACERDGGKSKNTIDKTDDKDKFDKNIEKVSTTFCHPGATGLFAEMEIVVKNCVANWQQDDSVQVPKYVEKIDLDAALHDVKIGYDIACTNAQPRDVTSSYPISKTLTPSHAVLLSIAMATQRLPNELQNEHLLYQTMLLAMREIDLHANVTDILANSKSEPNFLYSPIDKKKVGQASCFLWWNLLHCNRDLVDNNWQRIGIAKCSTQLMAQNDFTSSHLFRLLHDEAPSFMGLERLDCPSNGAVRPPVEFKNGNFERSPISDLLEDSLVRDSNKNLFTKLTIPH